MASSIVEVCNWALSHIGTKSTISSITENSNEARQCNILFNGARDFVLRDHPWRFAEKRVALADLDDAPPDWDYAYGYPSDCVNALIILPEDKETDDPVPFVVGVASDLNSKTILTDKEEAWLKYTARVTNPTVWDPMFAVALSWQLAIQLALPLTGKKSIRDDALRGYALALSAAKTADRNESEKDDERDAEWISGRQ